MAIPILSRFTGAWRDLRAFLATRGRHQYVFAALAVGMSVLLVLGFYKDSNITPPTQIVYVQNWPANRTDAEIIAQQKIDHVERQKALAARRAEYQRLGSALGIK